MSNYYQSLDFLFLVGSTAGVMISFLLYLIGRVKLRYWRTYSSIANSFALWMVILSVQFGDNPRALIDIAYWAGTMFMLLTNTEGEILPSTSQKSMSPPTPKIV
jgi:hypothetical protein